jgi:hypothetical protein
MIAALVAMTAVSMPAGSAPASKATTAKCKKVGDECLKSPLCTGGTTKNNCTERCLNKQANCLRDGAISKKAARGEDKGKLRVPIAKPTVQQPTKTLGTKSVPIRGGRPAQNRK